MAEETSPKVIIKKLSVIEAFTAYLTLGNKRSLQAIHNQFPEKAPSLRTLKEWSRKYEWVQKSEEYDKEEHEKAYQIALRESAKSKIDILSICQAIFGRFGERLAGIEKIVEVQGIKTVVKEHYMPNMADVERAYKIVKQELGEGLPEWEKLREINLTAVFQQIYNNAQRKREEDKSSKPG